MAKRKQAAEPEPPPVPQVGDKVTVGTSDSIYEISRVHIGGDEVDLQFPNTNIMRFRVRTDALKYVERNPPARTSNPFTEPESVLDTDEIMERIATVQQQNIERLNGGIDILKNYLKTQRAPETDRSSRGLTVDQHKAWKLAMGKIKKELGQ